MADVSSILTTTFIGILGVVVGAVISNYFNQRLARQAAKKDIIFKKKIEYFEEIVKSLNNNEKVYKNSINEAIKSQNKKKIGKIIENMKKNRSKFSIMTSSLYLDTKPLSMMIRQFVGLEKRIFVYFERLMKEEKQEKEEVLKGLKISLKEIEAAGNKIITILRFNLAKE